MTARLTCLVPFCRHTRGSRKDAPLPVDLTGWEWICRKHWLLIPTQRRRAYRRVWKVWHSDGGRGMSIGAIQAHPKWGKRAVHRSACDRLWDRLKHQVIQAAGGIA